MNIHKIWAVYFSPAGGTEKAVLSLAESIGEKLALPVERLDYTLPASREKTHAFSGADLVIWGTPVYAGRIPNKLLPYVQGRFTGGGALAVPVAVFGNRSFDDALSELCGILEANGFHTIAAAGLVAQHAFSDVLAAGRPDRADRAKVEAFAARIAEKTALLSPPFAPVRVKGSDPVGPYYTPKGLDGAPAVFLKAKPKTDMNKCNRCGVCVLRCPMGAISPADPADVPGTCIKCHACINRCPQRAKHFDDAAFLSHKGMLERDFTRRAEPEFFI